MLKLKRTAAVGAAAALAVLGLGSAAYAVTVYYGTGPVGGGVPAVKACVANGAWDRQTNPTYAQLYDVQGTHCSWLEVMVYGEMNWGNSWVDVNTSWAHSTSGLVRQGYLQINSRYVGRVSK